MPPPPRPRLQRAALVALAALALLLAACGRPASVVPTGTLTAARPLLWQAHEPPASLVAQPPAPFQPPTLAFAPSDGNTAYECLAPPDPTARAAQVWVTHDRAAHWSRTADIVTGGEVDSCSLTVDALNPSIVVAQTYRSARDRCMACFDGTYRSVVSHNAGATWAPLPAGPYDTLAQLTTRQGVTYALFRPHPADLATLRTALVVSHDGMRTWTPIDAALTAEHGRYAVRFWLNPANGELLALTETSFIGSGVFWVSRDGGRGWTRITTPGADEYIAQAPTASQPWHICGLHTSASNTQPIITNLLTCTLDGGATWLDTGGPETSPIIGIANDGSVLEDATLEPWTPGTVARTELRRLPPGGSDWQSLGPTPQTGGPITYVAGAGSGAGVLWAQPPGYNQPPETGGQVFTASYP